MDEEQLPVEPDHVRWGRNVVVDDFNQAQIDLIERNADAIRSTIWRACPTTPCGLGPDAFAESLRSAPAMEK